MANIFSKFKDGNEYLTLIEAAKVMPYGLNHLLAMAKSGRLKSFKMGEDWLTTKDWLAEFQREIKAELEKEINAVGAIGLHAARWARLAPKKTGLRGKLKKIFGRK